MPITRLRRVVRGALRQSERSLVVRCHRWGSRAGDHRVRGEADMRRRRPAAIEARPKDSYDARCPSQQGIAPRPVIRLDEPVHLRRLRRLDRLARCSQPRSQSRGERRRSGASEARSRRTPSYSAPDWPASMSARRTRFVAPSLASRDPARVCGRPAGQPRPPPQRGGGGGSFGWHRILMLRSGRGRYD